MNFATNSRILITGAASGIGLATARRLSTLGARQILVDRDGDALAASCRDLAGVTAHPGDVTDEAFWESMAPALAGLTHAVINAGVSSSGAIATLAFAEWRRVLAINLDGAFLTLRAAMRAIGERPGAIVLTASAAGIKAEPGIAAYTASKAGVIQLARVAAKEGAAQGLRVNAIAPGGVETPIWRGVPFFDELAARDGEAAAFAAMAQMATPIGRFARPDEIAAQIIHLLSPASGSITGAVLTIDGGYTL